MYVVIIIVRVAQFTYGILHITITHYTWCLIILEANDMFLHAINVANEKKFTESDQFVICWSGSV